MEITVQEQRVSFGSKYEIETPGSYYYAQKVSFSWPAKLRLWSPDDRTLATIQAHLSWFRSKYDFLLSDRRIFHFWCDKRWKRVFECQGSNNSYRIYGHKGLRYSVFESDQQIAAFSKNRVVFGKGNRYEIVLNDYADVIVIVCIVLAICTSEDDDGNAGVTIDAGSIGPEERPFDERWQPS